MENSSLKLLTPVSDERLISWLAEFYGKPVKIAKRELLRHRDLSLVERLWIDDALPETLIYKLVIPPWDIEQDLHERVLIPSISNSARLFLAAHVDNLTAMFIEDVGRTSLLTVADKEISIKLGEDLAKMHRAYSYRIDELSKLNILRILPPSDYVRFAEEDICRHLADWQLTAEPERKKIIRLAEHLCQMLKDEQVSLVHGDLFAENIIVRDEKFFIIDWSWFAYIGAAIFDVATLTMQHFKNESFVQWADVLIEAYADESGRSVASIKSVLPDTQMLCRLFFLNWLIERRAQGIMGTTIGPVDGVIQNTVNDLIAKF